MKNKNLLISANIALSSNDYKTEENSLAYQVFIDYPNDLIDNYFSISSLQKNFTPGLGFLARSNY